PHAVLRKRGGLAINLGRPVRGAVRVPVVRIPAAQGERMTSSPELAALFQWDRPPGLLGWAFRPRNFMNNPPKRINREHRANRRRGFSTLSIRAKLGLLWWGMLQLANPSEARTRTASPGVPSGPGVVASSASLFSMKERA